MAKQFTLGKNERLKSRKQTEKLFATGKKFSRGNLRVFYLAELNESNKGLLFGAGVSTKNFKKATDRNRVKRLIRESFRLQKIELKTFTSGKNLKLDVFFIYTGKEISEYKEVYENMGAALNKLQQLLNSH